MMLDVTECRSNGRAHRNFTVSMRYPSDAFLADSVLLVDAQYGQDTVGSSSLLNSDRRIPGYAAV
jgi:hypothetical protein